MPSKFGRIAKQMKQKDIEPIRNAILRIQNGVCAICGCEPKTPCLDHHHTKKVKGTGQIRGVLCSGCNIFIAKSENNCLRYGIKQSDLPHILRKVAGYLEQEQYPYIHPSEAPKPLILGKSSFKSLQKAYTSKYPNRKPLKMVVDKNGNSKQKLNKTLEKLFKEFDIKPNFLKR